jgi:hypothetical protein
MLPSEVFPSRKLTEPALAGLPPEVTLAVKVILCLTLTVTGSTDKVMLLLAAAVSAARNVRQISKLIEQTNL